MLTVHERTYLVELMHLTGWYLLFDTIWYRHILHWNQLCQFCQTVHILDFLTKLGAVKRKRKRKKSEGSGHQVFTTEMTSKHSPYEGFSECQQGANKPRGMDNNQ